MGKCKHDWVIHPDQDNTGKSGVRKYCSICKLVLTFYEPFDLVQPHNKEKAKGLWQPGDLANGRKEKGQE